MSKKKHADKFSPMKWTLIGLALFIVLYVVVVGNRYDDILRQMEGNAWVDDKVLHLFRWPMLGALLMCLPMAGVGLLASLVLKWMKKSRWIPCTLVLPLVLAYVFPPKANSQLDRYYLFSKVMNDDERVTGYIHLADEKQWQALLDELRQDGNLDTPLGLRYALLAESAMGQLPEMLFNYPVRSAEDFLFRGAREAFADQFNRQFYDNLGVYDEAFHQAMEYGLLQKEGCCMSSLRQLIDYSLAEGDWQVAEKYLTILGKACCNGSFIEERRDRLDEVKRWEERAVAEDDSTMLRPLRGDNFVGLYPLRSEMVRLAYYGVGDQQKTVDYLLCIALVEKNLDLFYKILNQFPNYQGRSLPGAYQQAFDILQSEGQAWRDAPPGTYAYYFYNVAVSNEEGQMIMRDIN